MAANATVRTATGWTLLGVLQLGLEVLGNEDDAEIRAILKEYLDEFPSLMYNRSDSVSRGLDYYDGFEIDRLLLALNQ